MVQLANMEAASGNCHIELDNSDMFMSNIEFPTPTNTVGKKCGGACGISSKLRTRRSSTKTILKDFAVSDVIVFEEALRRRILRKFKDTEREAHVYNRLNT